MEETKLKRNNLAAKELRDYLVRCFSGFDSGASAVVTETINGADVIVHKWKDGFVEYEIKTSKSDLLGEVKCARVAWGLDHISLFARNPEIEHYHTLSHNKLVKHKHYATNSSRVLTFVPAKFYFAVPLELIDYAVEKTKGLPYGVWSGKVYKPAKKLEHYQYDSSDVLALLNRACVEREWLKQRGR